MEIGGWCRGEKNFMQGCLLSSSWRSGFPRTHGASRGPFCPGQSAHLRRFNKSVSAHSRCGLTQLDHLHIWRLERSANPPPSGRTLGQILSWLLSSRPVPWLLRLIRLWWACRTRPRWACLHWALSKCRTRLRWALSTRLDLLKPCGCSQT